MSGHGLLARPPLKRSIPSNNDPILLLSHNDNDSSPDPPIDTPSVFDFPYKEWYDRASPTARPFVFFGLVCILTFLFGFIGISASDFFCPNLSTIAAVLGLNESTAGVTFLAFGNGSPDVFSTFAALNNGTFGLAVGELIGAATFSEYLGGRSGMRYSRGRLKRSGGRLHRGNTVMIRLALSGSLEQHEV